MNIHVKTKYTAIKSAQTLQIASWTQLLLFCVFDKPLLSVKESSNLSFLII